MFRQSNQGQGQLPMYLEDVIPQGHLVRVVDEAVDRLDLSKLLDKMQEREPDDPRRVRRGSSKNPATGRPAYHPRMLLKLIFYGYVTGTFSSRKLAQKAREDIPTMWLVAQEKPDFRTISDFRTAYLTEIADLFLQVLQLCQALGMIKLGHVAIDSSRLKANASKHKAMSAERLQKKIPELKSEVERLLQQATEADKAEDAELGKAEGTELPEDLAFKQKRLQRMEEAVKALQRRADEEKGKEDAAIRPNMQHNFTDPDSRVMTTRKGETMQGYSGQIAVDRANGVIVAADVTNTTTDKNALTPMVEQTEQNVGKPEKVSADSGYHSGPNLADLEEREVDGYIAEGREGKEGPDNPYHKRHFVYDPEQDAHRCPQNQWLPLKTVRKDSNGLTEWVYANEAACQGCSVRDLCTKAKKGGRTVTRDEYEPQREAMREKLQSKDGSTVYQQRKSTVEPVWGQLKTVMGFDRFSLRGLDRVKLEFRIVCSVHNLRKIASKLRKSPELWLTLRTWSPKRDQLAPAGA